MYSRISQFVLSLHFNTEALFTFICYCFDLEQDGDSEADDRELEWPFVEVLKDMIGDFQWVPTIHREF